MRYDSLVIGGGPAGATAAIYLARFGLTVALVEQAAVGGLLLSTTELDNYTGLPNIKGYELADAIEQQLASYDIARVTGTVTGMDLSNPIKRILVDGEWIEADTVIIASGMRYRKLGLPGEDRLLGRGISHCAMCDGNFFRGQVIGVIGGGDSALKESLYLARLVSRLHLIHRRDQFRGARLYERRLLTAPNVVMEKSTIITALHGEDALEGITVKRLDTGDEEFLPVAGLFVFIGFEAATDYLPQELEKDARGFIKTDGEMLTSIPGVFAAGDIRSKNCRQVATAVGDGATAAHSVHLYLEDRHGS